jgi:DNA topoisomerase-1
VIVEKVTKRYGTYRKCPTESCDWKLEIVPPEKKEAAAKAPGKKPAAKKPAAKKAPAKSAKPKA